MIPLSYVAEWSVAFAFTIVLELLVAVPLLRVSRRDLRSLVGICLIANLATHPAVWFVFPSFGLGKVATFLLSEAWAVGLEVWVYRVTLPALSLRRACEASFLANLASMTIYPLVAWLAS